MLCFIRSGKRPVPNTDESMPESDEFCGLQGRLGRGPYEHKARPVDWRGQLRRGVQRLVARPFRRRRQDAQVQRSGEAQREKRRGAQRGVPQRARNHEEAAPREARQTLVCVHYRRAGVHCHRVHVQRFAAQVYARG